MPTQYAALAAALAAEFDAAEVRTRPGQRGVKLRYITARTVMNRLDSVLGLENWWDSFQVARDNSIVCSLSIRLPDGQVVTKQGIGVTSASVGEDAEKGGESDALKRAAVKFGVGRYLYGEGMPHPEPEPGPAEREPGHDALPPDSAWSRRAKPRETERSEAPTSGPALYRWAREVETKYDFPMARILFEHGRQVGLSTRMVEWSREHVAEAYQAGLAAWHAMPPGRDPQPPEPSGGEGGPR